MLNPSINTPPAGHMQPLKLSRMWLNCVANCSRLNKSAAADADAKRATWRGREARAGGRGVLRSPLLPGGCFRPAQQLVINLSFLLRRDVTR